MPGLVGPEQVFIDGDRVIERSGERVFGGKTVEDGDNLHSRQVGDGDGFGQGAGIGIEAAAVKVDENAVGNHSGDRRHDADGNTGDDAALYAGRIDLAIGFTRTGLPCVGPRTALLQSLRRESVGGGACQELLRLGTEALRHRDDAGDVSGAVGGDVAGVPVGSLRGGGALLRGDGEREEEQARCGQDLHGGFHSQMLHF